jgi:hypothetical protein
VALIFIISYFIAGIEHEEREKVHYYLLGRPFCEKEHCRLFNAHWEEQMMHAQVESGRFCEHHSRLPKEASSSGWKAGRR